MACTGRITAGASSAQRPEESKSTDGADAAEKEGRKARIAQTCALLFHDVPRFLPQGSFSPLNHNSAPAQPDFTPKAQKEGMDKRPSLLSGFARCDFYSALVSGFSAGAAGAAGLAAAGAAGFTTGFGGYGSSFSGKRMIFFGHFWAHMPQPLHLS